jgi:hypothetical protein
VVAEEEVEGHPLPRFFLKVPNGEIRPGLFLDTATKGTKTEVKASHCACRTNLHGSDVAIGASTISTRLVADQNLREEMGREIEASLALEVHRLKCPYLLRWIVIRHYRSDGLHLTSRS